MHPGIHICFDNTKEVTIFRKNNNLFEFLNDAVKYITTLPKKIKEIQIICSGVDGIKFQPWETITPYRARISEDGLRGRIEMGLLL